MLDVKHIPDEDGLYRRIHPLQYDEKEDRPASGAFKDPEASVDWANHTTPEKSLQGYSDHHLVVLQAKVPRSKSLEVRHSPLEENYAHSLILGKKTDSIARALARSSMFVVKHV